MPIQLSGLASGLDTQTLIEQLMRVEAAPMGALQNKSAGLQNKNSSFQAINTRVMSLKDKAFALTTDAVLKAMLATSSDESIVTAKAGSNAAPGTYKVTVNDTASATRSTSWSQLGQSVIDSNQLLSDANTAAPLTAGRFMLTVTELNGLVNPISINVNAGDKWSDVFSRIDLATGGKVQATLTQNKITLSTDPTRVAGLKTGNQDDTSNFLNQTHLDTGPWDAATNTLKSTQPVGVVQINNPLINAKFATSLAASNGSFKINDVQVDWDANTDTMQTVMNKINASQAGVSAYYSSPDDKLIVTNKKTGSNDITFLDINGNLLQAMGVDKGDQITGKDASITIDGFNMVNGAPKAILGSGNEFKDVIPGVTLTAKKVGAQQEITVDYDKATTLKAIKDFVTEFNNTTDAIDKTRAKGEPNAFDADLSSLRDRLFSLFGQPITGITNSPNTVMAIGIGTTKDDRKHLSLDEQKMRDSITANRDRVADIFRFEQLGALPGDPVIKRGMAARVNEYLSGVRSETGVFKLRQQLTDAQVKSINQTIARDKRLLDQKRQGLVKQFTAMESAIAKMRSQQTSFVSQISQLQGASG